jgi:hypothetical protein
MGNIHKPKSHIKTKDFLKICYNSLTESKYLLDYEDFDLDKSLICRNVNSRNHDTFALNIKQVEKNIFEKEIKFFVFLINFLYGGYIITKSKTYEDISFKIYIDDILISNEKQKTNCYFSFNCSAIPAYFFKLSSYSDLVITLEFDDDIKIDEVYLFGLSSCDYILNEEYTNKEKMTALSIESENDFNLITYERKSIKKEKVKNIYELDFDKLSIPIHFTEKYKKVLAHHTSNIIKEELLEISMNPERLKSFLSIDELRNWKI